MKSRSTTARLGWKCNRNFSETTGGRGIYGAWDFVEILAQTGHGELPRTPHIFVSGKKDVETSILRCGQ